MADFRYIDVKLLDKVYHINELSFIEFKNFLKRIYSSADITVTFNELVRHCCKESDTLNYLEKILILLNIRGLVFGNDVSFIQDNVNIDINIQSIIDAFNVKAEKIEYNIGNTVYIFDYIAGDYLPTNKLQLISDSLVKIGNVDVTGISDKIELIPACNFNELYDLIYNKFYKKNFYIQKIDYDINFPNMYTFFENIFKSDLMSLYEMEFKLRSVLNFNTYDLENISLPECKMFMNFYIKDQNDSENN